MNQFYKNFSRSFTVLLLIFGLFTIVYATKTQSDQNQKKQIHLSQKYSGAKLESIKKSFQSQGKYRLIIQSELDESVIASYFQNIDASIEVTSLKGSIFLIKFPKNFSSTEIDLTGLENGDYPQLVGDFEVVEPQLFELESLAFFTGEDIINMWGQDYVGAYEWQEELASIEKVKVGVLDTGIDANHSDISANYDSNLSYDFVANTIGGTDDNGHGTQIAGIIGGSVNGTGIFGTNSHSDLVSLKVLNASGVGNSYDILEAIDYAIENNIKVLNLSFGGQGNPVGNALCNAISTAKSQGTFVVVSAGNSGQEVTNTIPAACPDAITVGAVGIDGLKSSFSNYGDTVSVYAPGQDIYTTTLGNAYTVKNGTSLATAFVSGLVAKEIAYDANISDDQLVANIKTNYNLLASYTPDVSGEETGTGSTGTGTVVEAPMPDYSHTLYYSGTFLYDGKWYGNSLYDDTVNFPSEVLQGVEVYTYDEYKNLLASQESGTFSILSIPTSGLVGKWDFNGNSNDTSVNNYNGTNYNTSWVSSSGSYQVASFNGSTSYIQMPNTASQASGDFSISTFFKYHSVGHTQTIYDDWIAGKPRFLMWVTSDGHVQGYTSAPVSPFITSTTQLVEGQWYHSVYTRSGNNRKLYINAVKEADFTNASVNNNDATYGVLVGTRNDITNQKFASDMGLLRFYNRVLTQSEIDQLYQEGQEKILGISPIDNNTSTNYQSNSVTTNTTSIYSFVDYSTQVSLQNLEIFKLAESYNATNNSKGDPVNLATGEFEYHNTFMSIPGKGMPFELSLTQKNQTYYNGVVGINWDHNYNQFLTEETNGNVLFFNGQLGTYRFIKNGSVFDSNPGLQATLTENGGLYTLTFDSGKVVEFNSDKHVSKIRDVYGNALNFTYSGGLLSQVTDTLGRNIDYTYYSHNRLKDVTDFNGRKVELTYFDADTSTGSLYDVKSITLNNGAGATKTISFEYTTGGDDTSNHSITKLIDAKGQTYVTNTYSNDRVATQSYGTGTISYSYTLSGSTVTKNTVTDRVGNIVEYSYDTNGSLTQSKHTTGSGYLNYYYTYDSYGRIATEKSPLGNGKKYTYDSNGNITQIRQKADITASDSGSDLVTTFTYTSYNKPATKTAPNGIVTQYTYNGSGSLTQETIVGVSSHTGATHNVTSTFTYDSVGQLATSTDGEGNTTTYSYTGGLLMSKTTGTGGTAITENYTYDSYGNILTAIDGEGKVTTYEYDSFNRLGTGTTDEGVVTTYTYDVNNNILQTSRGGASTDSTYDILDHILSLTESRGSGGDRVTSTTYTNNEKIASIQTATGAKIEYTYDEFGNLKQEKKIADLNQSSLDEITTYTYDNNSRLATKTDPLGNVTSYTYDLYDRLTRETLPDGTYRLLTYNADTTIASESWYNASDTIQTKSIFNYDGIGNIVKQTQYLDPANSTGAVTITSEYNNNFQITKTTDALGNSTTYAYDEFGRLVSTTDALGNVSTTVYDKRGLVTSKTLTPSSGTGTTTSYAYDDDGRLITETNALSDVKTYTYNTLGQVTQITDEAGNETDFTYDHQGNILTKTQYLPSSVTAVTTMVYDDRGNMLRVTDAEGHQTVYEYDALNRNTKVTYADGKNIVYTYNKNSQLVTTTDPNGTVVTHTYNSRNQLTAKSIATGTGVLGVTSETYTYDVLGRLATATDSDGHPLTFSYDTLNRLTQETQSGAVVEYTYDDNGNLTSITNSNGKTTSYGYDALNRNTTISSSGATVATYTYTGLLQTQTNLANGKTETKTYDALYRLQTLNNSLKTYTYSYDEVSNIESDAHKDYTYDPLYRLTQVQTTGTGTTLEQYSYDKVGNRNTSSEQTGTSTYTTNTLNQYTSQTGAINASYSYDNNGNLISDGTQTYSYDYKNRLVKVEKTNGDIIELRYDVLGRRYEKNISHSEGNEESIQYYYANQNIIQEDKTANSVTLTKTYINGLGTDNLMAYDVEEPNLTYAEREELDFCDNTVLTQTGTFIQYGWNDIVNRCNALSQSGAIIVENTYYFHTNNVGSVDGITDSLGTTVSEYIYDSYGNIEISGYDIGNSRLFTGREYDEETALYYNRARYYSPTLGRFISRDPIGIEDDINLYAYVANNPVNYVDRMGTEKSLIQKFGSYIDEKGLKYQSTQLNLLNNLGIGNTVIGISGIVLFPFNPPLGTFVMASSLGIDIGLSGLETIVQKSPTPLMKSVLINFSAGFIGKKLAVGYTGVEATVNSAGRIINKETGRYIFNQLGKKSKIIEESISAGVGIGFKFLFSN